MLSDRGCGTKLHLIHSNEAITFRTTFGDAMVS
jgi:hypothetical protein